jgi:hypothetical protein
MSQSLGRLHSVHIFCSADVGELLAAIPLEPHCIKRPVFGM